MQFDTTINHWHTAANTGRINGSNPCSEYMHLDNSACNLASLNLLKFLDLRRRAPAPPTPSTSRASSTPSRSSSPARRSSSAGPTTRPRRSATPPGAFRQLGIGYANLGALLMALGLPYDTDEGRAYAAAITVADDRPLLRHARPAPPPAWAPSPATPRTASTCSASCASTRRRPPQIDEELVPAELLARRPAVRGTRPCELGEPLRRAQLAGVRARPHRHDRPDDGLRHHRHRARPRPRAR